MLRRFCLFTVALTLMAMQVGQAPPFELSSDLQLTLPSFATYHKWEYSGCSVIPSDKNNQKAIFPGVHQVFIDPASLKHRREKGVFPDGTIILMEVSQIDFKESEAGFGYFGTGGIEVLAQVKDRRRFQGSGWGYYHFTDKEIKSGKKLKSAEASSLCQACHVAAAGDDEVFVQYYPGLKAKP